MSGNINVSNPDRNKRILLLAANPATSPTTGWPVGFWWAELTHPYWAFTEAGYEVEIRSPEGGALQADGDSDPEDQSGYSADDILSLGFKKSAKHRALIEDTKSIADVNPAHYDAIFVTGGQSPMISSRGNAKIQKLVADFYEAGKITALVCHGTCLLLETKLSSGELLVKGNLDRLRQRRGAVRRQLRRPADPAVLDRGRGPQDRGHELRRRSDVPRLRGPRRAARDRAAAVSRGYSGSLAEAVHSAIPSRSW